MTCVGDPDQRLRLDRFDQRAVLEVWAQSVLEVRRRTWRLARAAASIRTSPSVDGPRRSQVNLVLVAVFDHLDSRVAAFAQPALVLSDSVGGADRVGGVNRTTGLGWMRGARYGSPRGSAEGAVTGATARWRT